MRKLPLFEASATLIGTVIGAGILGIPFVIAQVGFVFGVGLMVILGVVMLLRHLILAEVVLRTPEVHQLPGYAGHYLGGWAKKLSLAFVSLGGFGTLLAYTVGEGEVLQAIFGGSSFAWSLAFFIIAAMLVLAGLNIIKRSELVMTSLILLITILIGFFAWHSLEFSNLTFWQPSGWIVPYGVLLFAFSGGIAIPEIREELKGRERLLLKSIVLGSAVVFTIYLLFTYLVLGVSGTGTTEVATIGLGLAIGPEMILIGNLLAFFTMGTSFLTGALGLKQMLQFDYKWKSIHAWWLTVLIPLVLFLLGVRDFITILGMVGGVLAGLSSVIMILIFWQARKKGERKPEFSLGPMRLVGGILIILFVLGAIFTLINA